MFIRRMDYKGLTLEQRIEVLGDTPDKGVRWMVYTPEIHIQKWFIDVLQPNSAIYLWSIINELLPVREVWKNELMTEIMTEQQINMINENRKIRINLTVDCESYGLQDDEVPF